MCYNFSIILSLPHKIFPVNRMLKSIFYFAAAAALKEVAV
jgi:hypothetical protein